MRQKQVRATYYGEEIGVVFEETFTEADYGIHGSPLVWEPSLSPRVVSVSILNVEVDLDALPADLQEAIMELADEVEWNV